jgi:tetratricopeptide (TPR) repeat protein
MLMTRQSKILLLFMVFFFFFLPFVALAQNPPATQPETLSTQPATPANQQESASGVGSAQSDQAILEKARKENPEKLIALDEKLAEALMLYYDGQYSKALPIFNEIARDIETTDVMWWIGTSAMNTGNLEMAVKKFKEMLTVDPNLHRVRLELSATYFKLGRYDEANKELLIVKAANPPPEVLANIDRMLTAIKEQQRQVTLGFRFGMGYMWDSNVSAGPDNQTLNIGTGTSTFTLAEDAAKVSDGAVVNSVGVNLLYDFGDKQGFMWNSDVSLYSTAYSKYGKYNYLMTDVSTGLWWVGRQDILKLPVGYLSQSLGSNYFDHRLSNIIHFDPSYEHFFNQYFSLKGSISLSGEFFTETTNKAMDNVTQRYEINPNIYLFNRRQVISLTAGYEMVNADNKIGSTETRLFSYESQYYGISTLLRFPTQTELFLRYRWNDRRYKTPPAQFWYPDDRIDRKDVYTVVLSQGFLKYCFASFAFNYTDNKSNADLYKFDKETYTLMLGFYF